METDNGNSIGSELPFLVTHWLANYSGNERIRELGAELATAFEQDGTFNENKNSNETYENLVRRWNNVPYDHLSAVVNASALASNLALNVQQQQPAVNRNNFSHATNATNNSSTVTIALQETNKSDNDGVLLDRAKSILHKPYFLKRAEDLRDGNFSFATLQRECTKALKLATDLKLDQMAIRREFQQVESSLNKLLLHQQHQDNSNDETERILSHLTVRRTSLLEKLTKAQDAYTAQNARAMAQFQKLKHLSRLYETDVSTYTRIRSSATPIKLQLALQRPLGIRRRPGSNKCSNRVRDSYVERYALPRLQHCLTINCHLFYPVYCLKFDKTRRYFITGADDHLAKVFRLGGYLPLEDLPSNIRDDNNHNSNGNDQISSTSITSSNRPLQAQDPLSGRRSIHSHTNGTGAVLISTLRGHNSVLTDMDVNVDNMLIATASEDGSVRVWSLRTSAVVAVLRHSGGVNMVQFDAVCPYRLVTCCEDGIARIWDVREACLLRCPGAKERMCDYGEGNVHVAADTAADVGTATGVEGTVSRGDPASTSVAIDEEEMENPTSQQQQEEGVIDVDAQLPPLPDQNENNVVIPPPLPQQPLIAQAVPDPVGVDNIDEGCRLLYKLRHGSAPAAANATGATGTRSRSKAVNIMAISTSCTGRHFATGSDDGIIRIWPCATGHEVTSSSTNHSHKPLASLTGFLSPITDISYSSKGDRLLSASLKDGVIRIWSWAEEIERRLYRLTPLLIRLSDHSSSATTCSNRANSSSNNSAASRRQAQQRNARQAQNILCDVACWTCDDQYILTAQSHTTLATENKLSVYDSYSGTCLVQISTESSNSCIVPHPTHARTFAVGSSAGEVCVFTFDPSTRRYDCLYRFTNLLEYGPVNDENLRNKPVGFLEGHWDKDGDALVMTDDSGRAVLFHVRTALQQHLELPMWMKEQYFASDYYELTYDPNLYPIDSRSQMLPHLCPRSARVNHMGSSLMNHVSEEVFEVMGPVPLEETKLCKDRASLEQYLEVEYPLVLRRNVSEGKSILAHPPSYNIHVQRGGAPVLSSQLQPQRSPTNNRGQPRSQRQTSQSRSQPRQLSSNYRYLDYAPDSASDNEDDDDEEFTVGDARRRSPNNNNRQSQRSRRQEQQSSSGGIQNQRRSRRTRNSLSSDSGSGGSDEDLDSDVVSEDDLASPTAAPVRNRRTNRGNRNRMRTIAQDDSDEEYINHDTAAAATRNRTRNNTNASSSVLERVRRSSRYAVPDSDDEIDEDDIWYYTNNQNAEPSHPIVKEYPMDYTTSGSFQWKIPTYIHPQRDWVTRVESKLCYSGRMTYLPQVNDVLVYLPYVHRMTLQKFPTHISPPFQEWVGTFLENYPVFQCRVKSVRYRFPPAAHFGQGNGGESIVAVCVLNIIGIPTITSSSLSTAGSTTSNQRWPWYTRFTPVEGVTGSLFELHIQQNDQPEYVIPQNVYTVRLSNLERMLWHNLNASGGREDEAFASTVLASYFAAEESSSTNRDMAFDPSRCVLKHISGVKIDRGEFVREETAGVEGNATAGFESLAVEYSCGSICNISPWEVDCVPNDDDDNNTIVQAIKLQNFSYTTKSLLLSMFDSLYNKVADAKLFEHPVGDAYRDYLLMTPLPMHLEFIHKRLTHGYYRSKYGLLSDVETMVENCSKYHHGSNQGICEVGDDILEFFRKEVELLEEEIEDSAASMLDVLRQIQMNEAAGQQQELEDVAAVEMQQQVVAAPQMNVAEGGSRGRRRTRQRGRQRTRQRADSSSLLENLNNSNYSENNGNANASNNNERSLRRSTRASARNNNNDFSSFSNEVGEGTNGRSARPNLRSANDRSVIISSSTSSRIRISLNQSSNAPIGENESLHTANPRRGRQRRQPLLSSPETRTSRRNLPIRSYNEDENSDYSSSSSHHNDDLTVASSIQQTNHESDHTSENEGIIATNKVSGDDYFDGSDESKSSDDDFGTERLPTKRKVAAKTKPVKKRAKKIKKEPEVSSPSLSVRSRRSRRSDVTYQDLSHSDIDDSSDDESDDEPPPRTKVTTKKRQPQTSRKNKSNVPKTKKKGCNFDPGIPEWPKINARKIKNVAKAIVKATKEKDLEEVFLEPISEEDVPGYCEIVKQPMDLRTIEEKIATYKHIDQLREDLCLMFENCCYFNGKGEYWDYAMEIWICLPSIFKEACDKCGVRA